MRYLFHKVIFNEVLKKIMHKGFSGNGLRAFFMDSKVVFYMHTLCMEYARIYTFVHNDGAYFPVKNRRLR